MCRDHRHRKSKGFIDTAIFRGGDALAATMNRELTMMVGGDRIFLVMAPAALVWALFAASIGFAEIARVARQRNIDSDERENPKRGKKGVGPRTGQPVGEI